MEIQLRRRVLAKSGAAVACMVVSVTLLVAGCANAPEIPLIPKAPPPAPPITQTVYVPVYVEVEKPAPVVPPPEPVRLPEEHEQSLALLIEMSRTASAPAEEVRKDFLASQAAFNKEKTNLNRMRYAWISALLGQTAGDDARLQGLLEPLVAKVGGLPPSHPLRPVADVMFAQLLERTRQMKEEQKKADALQQKLDALKAIEKNLLDRERRRN
jgi:hypothetical protein